MPTDTSVTLYDARKAGGQVYADRLADATIRELRTETAGRILDAAILPDAEGYALVDACSAECHRRGFPGLYAVAWNDVARSQGYAPMPVTAPTGIEAGADQ